MNRLESKIKIDDRDIDNTTTKSEFISLFQNELRKYNDKSKIFRFKSPLKIEGFNSWILVAFNNLEKINFIQINDANPELVNSYENWSNYKAKLIKESQNNFMKSILGEPDNIRPGAIEYLFNWANITSYEDPRSGDSAISIRFIY
ncbi:MULTISPECIES: hypothetical protein [Clostridium]|uniref:Uncharacterized protein n=1 Tax=Clostridium frigoriphilum TaxID=443253 RepID=A0ABU7UVQ0_9CLOT|nr:hypothetical protein [Clostridium sp. DSM 17811]MBU3102436.1 hypothetical protein [Clostridium sp. DSM 17811]